MPKLSGQERVYHATTNQFEYHRSIAPLWACTTCHTVVWDDIPREALAIIKERNKVRIKSNKDANYSPPDPKMIGQKALEEMGEEDG